MKYHLSEPILAAMKFGSQQVLFVAGSHFTIQFLFLQKDTFLMLVRTWIAAD